jgi:hypothetical protein
MLVVGLRLEYTESKLVLADGNVRKLKEISKFAAFFLRGGVFTSIFILNYWLTRGCCLEIDAVWLKIFNLKY